MMLGFMALLVLVIVGVYYLQYLVKFLMDNFR